MTTTLREVVRGGYRIFEKQSPEKQKQNILAAQYVEMLAATTNTKADTWPLFDIFGKGDGNNLVTEKNEINKRFFEHLAKVKGDTPEELLDIEDQIAKQIEQVTKDTLKSIVRREKDQVAANIAEAVSCYGRGDIYLQRAYECRRRLDAVEGNTQSPIVEDIRKIAKHPFFKFREYRSDRQQVIFETRNEVVLTFKNSATNTDITVNMGKFLIELSLNPISLYVRKFENNLNVSNYYHPHVAYNGSVCWGSASQTVGTKLPSGEVYDVFVLLAANLSNYNPGNPYISLQEFDKVAKVTKRFDGKAEQAKQLRHVRDAKTYTCRECYSCGDDVNGEDECGCLDRDDRDHHNVERCEECDCDTDNCECYCRNCDYHVDDCQCNRGESIF